MLSDDDRQSISSDCECECNDKSMINNIVYNVYASFVVAGIIPFLSKISAESACELFYQVYTCTSDIISRNNFENTRWRQRTARKNNCRLLLIVHVLLVTAWTFSDFQFIN